MAYIIYTPAPRRSDNPVLMYQSYGLYSDAQAAAQWMRHNFPRDVVHETLPDTVGHEYAEERKAFWAAMES